MFKKIQKILKQIEMSLTASTNPTSDYKKEFLLLQTVFRTGKQNRINVRFIWKFFSDYVTGT